MKLLSGPRPRDLTGTVKQFEVAPGPARLSNEPGEVKLSTGRQLHARDRSTSTVGRAEWACSPAVAAADPAAASSSGPSDEAIASAANWAYS